MKNTEKRQDGPKPLNLLVGGSTNTNPNGKNGKPFTLAPHSFDEALRKILAAPPEPKREAKSAKKPASKKTTKKR